MIGIGLAAHGLGDYERAAAAYTESAELARAGGYTWFLAVATGNLGDLARGAGRLRAGEGSLRGKPRTLPSARRRENDRWNASSVSAPSRLARAEATRPRRSCVESLEYAQALVDKELAIWCLSELAALDALQRRRRAGGQADRRDRDATGGNRARPVARSNSA